MKVPGILTIYPPYCYLRVVSSSQYNLLRVTTEAWCAPRFAANEARRTDPDRNRHGAATSEAPRHQAPSPLIGELSWMRSQAQPSWQHKGKQFWAKYSFLVRVGVGAACVVSIVCYLVLHTHANISAHQEVSHLFDSHWRETSGATPRPVLKCVTRL